MMVVELLAAGVCRIGETVSWLHTSLRCTGLRERSSRPPREGRGHGGGARHHEDGNRRKVFELRIYPEHLVDKHKRVTVGAFRENPSEYHIHRKKKTGLSFAQIGEKYV